MSSIQSKPRLAAVSLFALTLASATAMAESVDYLDMHHTDLQINYSPPGTSTEISPNGGWNNGFVVEEGEDPNYPGDGTGQGGFYKQGTFQLLVTNNSYGNALPNNEGFRPAGSDYNFIGVGAGQPFFHLSQNDYQNQQEYLGFAADDLNPADFSAWNPNDPRAPSTNKWLQINLLGVHGLNGAAAPGDFSAWDSGTLGGPPTVWFSTADGGGDSSDKFITLVGSHHHTNWGFSAAGDYVMDLSVTTTLADGTLTTSPESSYTFHVTAAAVPEPASLALLGGGLGGLALLRFKRRRS